MLKVPDQISHIFLYTGNILNLNEIKRKLGRTPTEELLATVQLMSDEYTLFEKGDTWRIHSRAGLKPTVSDDPKELICGVKLFTSPQDVASLNEAINNVLEYLDLKHIDSVVLANPGEDFQVLMTTWKTMEQFVTDKKVIRIGVSNIETEMFIDLYNQATVKPEIIQINYDNCCVVPELLNEFTKKNEIQLLTHSDPKGTLLPDKELTDAFNSFIRKPNEQHAHMIWAARFLLHAKHRGVLTTKGFIVSLELKDGPCADAEISHHGPEEAAL